MSSYAYPDGAVSLSTMTRNLNVDFKYIDKFLKDSGYLDKSGHPTKFGLSQGISIYEKNAHEQWPIYSKDIQQFVSDNIEYMKEAYRYAFQKGGFVQEGPVMVGTKCVDNYAITYLPLNPDSDFSDKVRTVVIQEVDKQGYLKPDLITKFHFFVDNEHCVPLFDNKESIRFFLENYENGCHIQHKRQNPEDLIQKGYDKYHSEREITKSLKAENEALKQEIEEKDKELRELRKQIWKLECKIEDYENPRPSCPFMR